MAEAERGEFVDADVVIAEGRKRVQAAMAAQAAVHLDEEWGMTDMTPPEVRARAGEDASRDDRNAAGRQWLRGDVADRMAQAQSDDDVDPDTMVVVTRERAQTALEATKCKIEMGWAQSERRQMSQALMWKRTSPSVRRRPSRQAGR